MKKYLSFLIMLFVINGYAQTDTLDRMELRDGQILFGKVEKIKSDIVEFRESETGLIYETQKKDIRYIQLVNGKVLTFEEEYNEAQQNQTQPPQQEPVVIEKDSGPSTGLIILATVGVVLVVLLLIGAAAQ